MFLFGVGVGLLVLPAIGLLYVTYDYLTSRGLRITCICDKQFGHNEHLIEHDPNREDLKHYIPKQSLNVITNIRAKAHFWFKCPARR